MVSPDFPTLDWRCRYTNGEIQAREYVFDGKGLDRDFLLARYFFWNPGDPPPPILTAADFGDIQWASPPGPVGYMGSMKVTIVPIPEPATLSLLMLGGLAVVRRRR